MRRKFYRLTAFAVSAVLAMSELSVPVYAKEPDDAPGISIRFWK